MLEHIHHQFARVGIRNAQLAAAVPHKMPLLLRVPVFISYPARAFGGNRHHGASAAQGDDKLAAMRNAHLVVCDLFLPQEVAAGACAGLKLTALETLLARARPAPLSAESLEARLCEMFGAAVAPVTLRADGMAPGAAYWLRADPVHMLIRRDRMIMQADVPLSEGEAAGLCASLNAHFSGERLRFFAPHPQRWYLQLDAEPDMKTCPLSQVAGKNVHAHLPQGPDALRWHGVLNEIQMLFHDHALNLARETRGELPINSVWLWGGGRGGERLARPCAKVWGDSHPADAFARAAGIPSMVLPDDAREYSASGSGDALLAWEGLQRAVLRGDLQAWRDSMLQFERRCAAPLLDALRAGRIAQIALDVPGEAARRFVLTRGAAWKLWCRPRPLASYGASG